MRRAVDLDEPLDGVRYEKRGGIARITLDRPDRGNSLTPSMHGVMKAIWEEVRDDASIRVAILTAAGERHFSTGFDVAAAGTMMPRTSSRTGPSPTPFSGPLTRIACGSR